MSNKINKRIEHFRIKANLTQTQVAQRLGIDRTQYEKIENDAEISCELVKKIADVLDSNVLEILYGDLELSGIYEKRWFIKIINNYTSPYIFIREENQFVENYYKSMKESNKKTK